MLGPRFKTLCLVSSLIGHEQGQLLKNITKKPLFLMLLKYYYHLHPLVKSKRRVVEQEVEEDKSLDILR
jgi:hypothetical protein